MRKLLFFLFFILISNSAWAQYYPLGFAPYPYWGFGPQHYYAPQYYYRTIRRVPRISNENRYMRDKNTLIAKEELGQVRREYALEAKERRDAHRPDGPSAVTIDGIHYPSYDAFKRTRHYRDWKAWHKARNHWERQKKEIDANYYAQQRKELFRKLNERRKQTGTFGWYARRMKEANRRAEEWMGYSRPWEHISEHQRFETLKELYRQSQSTPKVQGEGLHPFPEQSIWKADMPSQ